MNNICRDCDSSCYPGKCSLGNFKLFNKFSFRKLISNNNLNIILFLKGNSATNCTKCADNFYLSVDKILCLTNCGTGLFNIY